jgi:predicted DNA-binding mobile mystery protein A
MRIITKISAVMRRHLEERVAPLKREREYVATSWIRSVREALGMSGRQLAARLGVEPPRVTALEKAEVAGNVTVHSLQKAADALDCDFVYAFVPRTSFEDTLRKRAQVVAARRIDRVSHTMRLEDQELSVKDEGALLQDKIEELMREMPRWLWDEDDRV